MSIFRSALGWFVCGAFVTTIVLVELRPDRPGSGQPGAQPLAERAERIEALVSAELHQQFVERLAGLQPGGSHQQLVAEVEAAVARGDHDRMASSLHELGLRATADGDLDAADAWLADALTEYELAGDERGRAGVLLDIGRLHMAFRERAQRAALDYDDLLVARWALYHGYREAAREALEHIASSSLQLDRHGTAASALGSLFELHRRDGNYAASLAIGQRVLELHASAGNLNAARRMLDALRDQGLTHLDTQRAEQAIQLGLETFEAETRRLGLVRDYTQLYHQLMARGDPVGAWRYRRQAEELRRSTSRRAMYRRQPDVLVELYRSNRSIEQAASALRDAELSFARLGMVEQMLQSAALQRDIR